SPLRRERRAPPTWSRPDATEAMALTPERPGRDAGRVTDPAETRTVPARPRVVSPGRLVALFVALIGFYVVWPSLVAVFGSFEELRHVNPIWFLVMVGLEAASFLCIWALIGLCLRSRRYFLIGTSQLAGNSVSRLLPGGNAVGAALQYRLLVAGGMEPTRIATGLTAVSLINVATVFALPLLSVPAILGGVAINRGLARAAWLGVGAFILLLAGVPAAQATLATLAYRLASYWLPIAVGPVAYGLYKRRAPRWIAEANATGPG